MAALTDRQTFREMVAQVAEKARAKLPEQVNGRIESAVKLVLGHDVTPQDDGSIAVGSSTDPLKVYRLTGTTCECQDFTRGQAPDGWCQHRIAAGIQKRVRELLPAEPAPVMPGDLEPWSETDVEGAPEPTPQEPPTARPASLPEAAFSLTLKGTLNGQEALLTARGQTAAEFKRNLEAIRGLLDAPRVTGEQVRSSGPTQGHGEGWCHVHNVQMKENVKDGRWCKGR